VKFADKKEFHRKSKIL